MRTHVLPMVYNISRCENQSHKTADAPNNMAAIAAQHWQIQPFNIEVPLNGNDPPNSSL